MDPTSRFFGRLRKLAVTVESQTASLQRDFENRHNEEDDAENTAKAMRAYHELNCEVENLKEQIQEQLTQQKTRVNEVSSFIKASTLMQKSLAEDVQALRSHWEKYGYTAPRRPNENKCQEPEAEVADEDETKPAGQEEGGQEETGGHCSSSPPALASPSFMEGLRTPQLVDFGLSEIQLKRVLAGAYTCSAVPPMPKVNFPNPLLSSPELPKTPKCALWTDDDEQQTPQMRDFGISEHTMSLNNDFTMNLCRKHIAAPQRQSQDVCEPPAASQLESSQSKDEFKSPEPPVFCTPGFKIKKTNCPSSPPAQEKGEPAKPPSTPQVPAFQTPYLKRLATTQEKKAKIIKTAKFEKVPKDFSVNHPELDGPTQEGLGAPCDWMDYPEPGTPEMPDLSSVTQDICKLVSNAQLKKAHVANVRPQVRLEKETNRTNDRA